MNEISRNQLKRSMEELTIMIYHFRFCQNDGKDVTGKYVRDTQQKLKYTVLCANISAMTY